MKADLHVHTNYSYDSISSPQEIVKAALRKGLDCIAICDHGEIIGAIETIKAAFNKPLLIIPGIEIKSKEGDILGLNVHKIIPNNLSAKETIIEIKKEGGIAVIPHRAAPDKGILGHYPSIIRVYRIILNPMAVIPHPFGYFCSFKGNLDELKNEIDAVEVLNSNIFKENNRKTLKWVKKNDFAITAGSDAHSPSFIGSAYLEIPGEKLSIAQIFEQIRDKKVRAIGRETNIIMKGIAFSERSWAKIQNKI